MNLIKIHGFNVLIRRIILAEVTLTVFFFILDRLVDFETHYAQTALSSVIEIGLLTIIIIGATEVLVILGVIYSWYKLYNKETPPISLEEILKQKEDHNFECKQTLRWDLHQQKINKALEKAVLKTIAAFANSDGGHLVIGLTDDYQVTGLTNDYETLKKKNRDGFEVFLNRLITDYLGMSARTCCTIQILGQENNEICLIKIIPCNKPVYYKDNLNEELFVRTGNSTTSLTISQANQYISDHSAFQKVSKHS